MQMLIGALLIIAGYFLCYFTVPKKTNKADSVKEIEVKRIKPNMRNPLQTYTETYDRYKSRDTGLYEPVKPKRGE